MGGFDQHVAFVDLTTESVEVLDIPRSIRLSVVGGRGLGVALLAWHGPSREPLEDGAILCMMAGPLTGSDFPLSNRLALVFRSPLTRTVAWAMTGGYIATELRKGGLDGIVVKGRAKRPCYLLVHGSRITVEPASALWGHGAVETVSRLQAAHAARVHEPSVLRAGARSD